MDLKPERNALPERGARFFREGEDVMFQFVIDPGNIVGPRAAMRADSERHPEAWAEFAAADASERPASAEASQRADMVGPAADYDRPEQPPAKPETIVPEKDMDGFAERVAPPKPKRAYRRRAA